MLHREPLFGRRNDRPEEKNKNLSTSGFDSPASQVRNALAPSVSVPPPNEEARKVTTHAAATPAPKSDDAQGSQLIVGPNIKLKGVEITDCDTLVVEGHVEAVMDSRMIQIAPHGTFSGTAGVDVAEINGVFSGELTVRKCMKVHATGKVSGKIRYGKLVIEEGGEISGDIKTLSDAERSARAQRSPEKPGAASASSAQS